MTDSWDSVDWTALAERVALAQHQAINDPDRQVHGFAAAGLGLRRALSRSTSGLIPHAEARAQIASAVAAERALRVGVQENFASLLRRQATEVADALESLSEDLVRLADGETSRLRGDGMRSAAAIVAAEARKRRAGAA